MSYHLSPTGRRFSLLLLVGALVVWALSLWTLGSTVGTVAGEPQLGFFAALWRNIEQGLELSQFVPALLTVAMAVATPFVVWNILTEYGARYTPGEDGLRFEAPGVRLLLPWRSITVIRQEPFEDATVELIFDHDYTRQIHNPLVRWLHRRSFGRNTLPLYAGLARRDELVAEISQRTGLVVVKKEHFDEQTPQS